MSATQVLPPLSGILTTFDVPAAAQFDAEGAFYEAATDDGSVIIQIRDLPPGTARVDLAFRPIGADELGAFSPEDETVLGAADGISLAGEILVFDADTGAKIDVSLDVVVAPLDVLDAQFLLWLVEGPDGSLRPVEFRVDLDGTQRARFDFDLFFIILDRPAPEANLRAGLEALWRFNTGGGFEAFFPAFPALVVPTYRLYDPMFVVASQGGALMRQELLLPVRRTVVLGAGDNLVSYTGGGGSILNTVDAAVVGRAHAIWVWRDSVGAWLGFFPGQLAAIQGVNGLALSDLAFMNTSAGVAWDMR